MDKVVLYGMGSSPPVRACLLTLKALELPFEYVEVNPATREHLSKKYLQKNPQHTVPTLEDDGEFIWDSHAIMTYLVRKFGKNDALYPQDFFKRAVVDQRLHFDTGTAFTALRNISVSLFLNNENNVPQHKMDDILDAYDFMETFLKDHPYIAGEELTVADFSLITTLTALAALSDINEEKYPKLIAWIKRLEQLPYYEETNTVNEEKTNSIKTT